MLTVHLPDSNFIERQYVWELMLGHFLGLSFCIEKEQIHETILMFGNGANLIFPDHFFHLYEPTKKQLSSILPTSVKWIKKVDFPFSPEEDLPLIFGNAFYINEANIIRCEADFAANIFFMLTRWEEAISSKKDEHNRFPSKASLAVKNNFIHRPVVNEWIEALWAILKSLGIQQQRKKAFFQIMPTHDVDSPKLWTSPLFFLKKNFGDLIKRKKFNSIYFNFKSYFSSQDPFDTFDYLMELSENNGLHSHFFFLTGGTSKWDNNMENRQKELLPILEKINQRGHHIGVHPSYFSIENYSLWEKEVERFKKNSPQNIDCGRQHFLKFQIPETWRFWENANMKWDSSLGYADRPGFRCGTCWAYPIFDIFLRKKLNLEERPLVLMDATLANYMQLEKKEALQQASDLFNRAKKYGGYFTILWHNSSFRVPEYADLADVYEEIISW